MTLTKAYLDAGERIKSRIGYLGTATRKYLPLIGRVVITRPRFIDSLRHF